MNEKRNEIKCLLWWKHISFGFVQRETRQAYGLLSINRLLASLFLDFLFHDFWGKKKTSFSCPSVTPVLVCRVGKKGGRGMGCVVVSRTSKRKHHGGRPRMQMAGCTFEKKKLKKPPLHEPLISLFLNKWKRRSRKKPNMRTCLSHLCVKATLERNSNFVWYVIQQFFFLALQMN